MEDRNASRASERRHLARDEVKQELDGEDYILIVLAILLAVLAAAL